MEKRVIVFILLTFLVFLGFQRFAPKKAVQNVSEPKKEAVENSVPKQEAISEPISVPAPATAENINPSDTIASAQKIVIDGDKYSAIIDNKGGVLSSWLLKEYKSMKKEDFEMIARSETAGKRLYPGSLIFGDQNIEQSANNEFYQVTVENGKILTPRLKAPVDILLKLARGGLVIEKRYSFEKENYLANVSLKITKDGKPVEGRFFLGQDIGPLVEHLSGSTKLEAIYNIGGKVKRESPPKDPQELKKIEGNLHWVGLDMQFFSMIIMPKQPLPYFNIQKRPSQIIENDGKKIDRELLTVTTPINGSLDYQLYIGPKNQESLKAVKSADLSEVINYGMFTIIIYPLLTALRWIYQYVHNYGFAIILLTFIISIILFPFRLKQMLSMKKMQVIQPKIKAIQDKYKKYKADAGKRAEMNQEMMALYKENKVNPLGGCLPILLQMPLLLAFYSLLGYSIELRQAPFIWWIHDLSIKDPYWVLPIVMGITSFITQKMTPMGPSTDPVQAKMMMLMPLLLTVMFFNLSSGLNLYFLCSNIFQIVFQKITERWIPDGKATSPSK
jgi:YidC/Oxa1 family membrane protein insertase